MSNALSSENYPNKLNIRTTEEIMIDVLFGLNRATEALVSALIETHPDCEKLLRRFDERLQRGINSAAESDRSVMELAAIADSGEFFREQISARAKRQADD